MEVFCMLRAYFNFDNKRCTNVQPRITEIIGKVKTIVTHFKYSSKTTAKLRAFQESKSKVKNAWKLLFYFRFGNKVEFHILYDKEICEIGRGGS
jgi:hypothetical protein